MALTLDRVLLLSVILLGVEFLTNGSIKYDAPVSMPRTVKPPVRVDDPRFVCPEPYRAAVFRYCALYGVPLDIGIRLAFEESRWDENCKNHNTNGSDDDGLFQLNSYYHPKVGVEENIRRGLEYLAWCYKHTGTWRGAIKAFNAGLTGALTAGAKTQALAARVVEGRM